MERCDTDLRKVCAHPQGVTLPQARKLAYGLLVGCRYLHSAGIYHRDLKPANCLVNWDCHVKICDFNLARTAVDDPPNGHLSPSGGSEEEESTARAPRLRRTLTAHVASRWYRSPEVILQLPYSGAMDVWSAGCIIAELFLALNEGGRTPRQGALFPGRECYGFSHAVGGGQPADWAADSGDQLDMIFNVLGTPSKMELEAVPSAAARAHACSYPERPGTGLRASLPAEAGEEGLELLAKMLRLLPGDRASMSEALQHPFFARVRRHSDEESGVAPGRVDIDFDEAELEQTVITEETVSMKPNRPKHEINLFSPIRGTPSSSVWSG
uniref:Protein kinase domain-containing protein n=1 Tax=Pyrodinium bahamense TaxID=73915 RepID=A0A7S0B9X4_9DINO